MRFVILTHVALTALVSGLVFWKVSSEAALLYAWGSGLMSLSILVFGVVWLVLTRKKLVALGFALVVIKFAIFGVAIHFLLEFGRSVLPVGPGLLNQPAFWLAGGVATITGTIILAAVAGALRALYLV